MDAEDEGGDGLESGVVEPGAAVDTPGSGEEEVQEEGPCQKKSKTKKVCPLLSYSVTM